MARLETYTEPFPSYAVGASWSPTTWKEIKSTAVIGEFPPGQYFIGDLYQVMRSNLYDNVWENHFNSRNSVFESSIGERFASADCGYENGIAKGVVNGDVTKRRRYPFEGSTLGICSVSCCCINLYERNANNRFGTIHEFTDPVEFLFVNGKKLTFTSGEWSLVITIDH